MPRQQSPAEQNSYETSVFLNLPYDEAYRKLFLAYIAGISAYGLTPHIALEDATSKRRLERICDLIQNCKYSIHDFSNLKLKSEPQRPRLNMPFELGLAVARDLKSSGKPNWFIFAKDVTSLKSSLSDLDGADFQIHSGKPDEIFKKLRNIIVSSPSREVSAPLMEYAYKSMIVALPSVFEDAGQKGRTTVFEAAVFRKLCAIAAKAIERKRAMAVVSAIGEAYKNALPGAVARRAKSRK